jgi:hypothetical protein
MAVRRRASMPPSGPTSEHAQQAAFIQTIRRVNHPAAKLTFAIPNGFMRTKGMRIRAWQEGLVSGVLDTFNPWPMPEKNLYGHWIELKVGANDLTAEQRWFKAEMEQLGHRVDVCWDWLSAVKAWADYLDLEIVTG